MSMTAAVVVTNDTTIWKQDNIVSIFPDNTIKYLNVSYFFEMGTIIKA